MQYRDLREFLARLEATGELARVRVEVDPHLEMTEVCDRTLRAAGPAILFEKPKGHTIPVLGNLFGTPRRVAMGMGQDSIEGLREVGRLLAFLKEPEPPRGMRDAWEKLPIFRQVFHMAPTTLTLRGRYGNTICRPLSFSIMDRSCAIISPLKRTDSAPNQNSRQFSSVCAALRGSGRNLFQYLRAKWRRRSECARWNRSLRRAPPRL